VTVLPALRASEPAARASRVGFVGLGSLGLVLAGNLLARGHEVRGYRRGSLDALTALGGVATSSPAEAAAGADLLITCLPTPDALNEVVSGPTGFLAREGPLPVLAELSTFDITVKASAASDYAARGGIMLDCPISGIPSAVAARQGLMLASGDRVAFERWRPVFSDLLDRSRPLRPSPSPRS
jgi:L-threonate 2-dehydrogenase